jgi:predicted nucleic acid-binding protein
MIGAEHSGFADSNIWLYALLDLQDIVKADIAKTILKTGNMAVSAQVINEVSRNLLKSGGFEETEIAEFIRAVYENYKVIETSEEILLKASELRVRYNFSFWDSLIVASALYAEADILYTEDMQDNMLAEDTLRIRNPFKTPLS